jgi:chemotaxis protein MotB
MAKKKKHEKEPNHERWLVSYADFITLLFAVFVVLYAMGQTDKKKAEQVIASLSSSFGLAKSSPADKVMVIDSGNISIIPSLRPQGATPAQRKSGRAKTRAVEKDFKAIKTSIEAYLLKTGAQDKVSVEMNRRGLVVSLKEAGFFDSGSASVKQSSFGLLSNVAGALADYTNPVRIEGHTDNVPISSQQFPSNWELSAARSIKIGQFLIKNYEFDPTNIAVTGYGEYRPVADNNSAEGRSKNRRVDIVLLSAEFERSEP